MEAAFSEFVCAYTSGDREDGSSYRWGEPDTTAAASLLSENDGGGGSSFWSTTTTASEQPTDEYREALQQRALHNLTSHQTESFGCIYEWLVTMYMSAKPLRHIMDGGFFHESRMYSVNFCRFGSKQHLSPYMCRILRNTCDLDIMGIAEYKVYAACDPADNNNDNVEKHPYHTWDGRYFQARPTWSHRSAPLKLGVLPLMTLARGCLEREGRVNKSELDAKNYGGHFTIGGSCKVMPPVERLVMNHPLLFLEVGKFSHKVEYRAQHVSRAHRSSSNIILSMSRLYKKKARRILVTIPYMKTAVPLMVLFLALGWTRFEVLQGVRTASGRHFHTDCLEMLESLWYDTEQCRDAREAQLFLAQHSKKDFAGKEERAILQSIQYSLRTEVLPNLGYGGPDLSVRKGALICDLLWRLLLFTNGHMPATDRRAMEYIRYDTAAFSIINLMTQLWGSTMRESQSLFRRLLQQHKGITYTKLFHGHTTTGRLLECINSGMWSAKKTNDKMRSGMSHLQDRNNVAGSVSQLRQVHSSNSENDLNEDRRQLPDHSRGRICPTETPEGPHVGIIKYLALGARISTGSDATLLMQLVLATHDWIPLSLIGLVAQGQRPWGRHTEVLAAWAGEKQQQAASPLQQQAAAAPPQPTPRNDYDEEEDDEQGTVVVEEAVIAGRPDWFAPTTTIERSTWSAEAFSNELHRDTSDLCKLWVNGTWYGWIREPRKLRDCIHAKRRCLSCDPDTGCAWYQEWQELRICTDAGKVLRPLGLAAPPTATTQRKIDTTPSSVTAYDLTSLRARGLLEFVDAAEEVCGGPDEWQRKGYFELAQTNMLGVSASLNPLVECNQVCRNLFMTSMMKQAVSVWGSRPRGEMSTFELQRGQRPLMFTQAARQMELHEEMTGHNLTTVVAALWGFNIEDALGISKNLLDNRAYHMYSNRRYSAKEARHGTNNNVDTLTKPDPQQTRGLREANYDLLEVDGLIPGNTPVDDQCIVIGKVGPGHQISTSAKAIVPPSMQSRDRNVNGVDSGVCEPTTSQPTMRYRDQSINVRKGDRGVVVNTLVTTSRECKTAKVHVRIEKVPEVGDKFASSHGQKGTAGIVMAPEDMPYNAHGEPVDIVVGPHNKPTRKTDGHDHEGHLCMAAAFHGGFVEVKTFDNDLEQLHRHANETLHSHGRSVTGKELFYDGTTGEPMQGVLTTQRIYYKRLHHNPSDKHHSVDLRGPRQLVTGQCRQGKRRNGATRFGAMENKALVTHGAPEMLRERMTTFADECCSYICQLCGFIGEADPQEGSYYCRHCDVSNSLCKVELSKTVKAYIQEQMTNGARQQFILTLVPTFGDLVWCPSAKTSHPAHFRCLGEYDDDYVVQHDDSTAVDGDDTMPPPAPKRQKR